MKYDIQTARNCYYAVTHPLQMGASATYNDWLQWIRDTVKCTPVEAIAIAALDEHNRLHSTK